MESSNSTHMLFLAQHPAAVLDAYLEIRERVAEREGKGQDDAFNAGNGCVQGLGRGLPYARAPFRAMLLGLADKDDTRATTK